MKKDTSEIMNLFLHDKPANIILSLKNSEGKYASIIAKEIDCTYTHVLKILNQLKNYGLVEFQKEGRIKIVKLTPLGEDIAHEIEGLKRHLERIGRGEQPTKEDEKDEKNEQES